MFNFFKKKQTDETKEQQKEDILIFSQDLIDVYLKGQDCDEVADSYGEFGKVPNNPIPVNGPIGSIKYLSRLRTKDESSKLIFHRLGSINVINLNNPIDVYEVVSTDAKNWDILYIDMYHPRRSKKIPDGYIFSVYHEFYSRMPFGFGYNKLDGRFPFNIGKFIDSNFIIDQFMSRERLVMHYNKIIEEKEKFLRPESHKVKVRSVLNLLNNTAFYQPDIDIVDFDISDL